MRPAKPGFLQPLRDALALLEREPPTDMEKADLAVRLGRPDVIPDPPRLPLEARE